MAGTTPFRGEKATNWEGGFRVPMVIRWPGTIQPGTIHNEIFSHYDLHPDLCGCGGRSGHRRQVPQGHAARRQDLQGPSRRLQPDAVLQAGGRRNRRARTSSTGTMTANLWRSASRTGRLSSKSRSTRASAFGRREFTNLRVPKLFNLRADPFERGDKSILYDKWLADRAFVQVPMQAFVAQWLRASRSFRSGRSLRASTSTR